MLCFYQQNKSFEFKGKFRQASDHCKRVFEAVKLVYTTKTKEFITSQNHVSRDFSELQIVFSAKVNLLYLLHSTAEQCCLLHLIKQSYLLKTFLTTLILMTWVSLCLFPLLELIWNYNISVTPKMVKNVIANLNSSKASGPNCISVVVLRNCEP